MTTRLLLCWMVLLSVAGCGSDDGNTSRTAPAPAAVAPAPPNGTAPKLTPPEEAPAASVAHAPGAPAEAEDDQLDIELTNRPLKGDLDRIGAHHGASRCDPTSG